MARKTKGEMKGLTALIAEAKTESGNTDSVDNEISISLIVPNPNQPRKNFEETSLMDLSESIKNVGLLQPILVRPIGNKYQIVAGERRWQACKLAGLESVPVRIVEMDDENTLRVALIENLQRSNLNAIEEAQGYKDLMDAGKLTQAEVAEAVSKSRTAVTNTLRLLDLPDEVQKMIFDGDLTAGHARAILSISDDEKRIEMAQRVVNKHLSVRETENIARLLATGSEEKPVRVPLPRSYKLVAKELKSKLDTPVRIKNTRGKNKIEIEFSDENDLQRIYQTLFGE